jgi:hypothetical protein
MSPQQREGLAHFKAGGKHYKEGRYSEAVAEFERALDLFPNPTLLFNLAQAHRHNGSAENAIFFFKRYLIMLPHAPDRADVEMRIHGLEQALATAPAGTSPARAAAGVAATAPASAPTGAPTPAAPATPTPATGSPMTNGAPAVAADASGHSPAAGTTAVAMAESAPPATTETTPATSLPTAANDELQEFEPEALINDGAEASAAAPRGRLVLLAHAGLGFPHFGGAHDEANSDLYAFAGELSASYAAPLPVGSFNVGLAGSYAPVSYRDSATGAGVVTHLVGGYATAGLRFWLGETVSIGPSLALGVVWWAGLKNGNFFTASMQEPGGAVAMPSVRIAMPLLWRVGSHLLAGVEPAWSFHKITTLDLAEKTPSLRWLTLSGLFGFSL